MVTVQIARYFLATYSPNDVPAASTIRSWIHRGKVQRTPDGGVDMGSLLQHMGILDQPEQDAA